METLTRTIEEMLIFFSFLPFGGVLIILSLGCAFLFLVSYLILICKSIESSLGFICWLVATSSIVAIVYGCYWIRKQSFGYQVQPFGYQVLGYLVFIVLFYTYFLPVAIILDEKNFRRQWKQWKRKSNKEEPPDWYKAWKKKRESWIARNKILQDREIRGWIERQDKRCEEWDRINKRIFIKYG